MKILAHSIWNKVKNSLIVNCYYEGETKGLPSIKFTFYNSIKSWSHHVSIAYDEKNVYLFTASLLPIDEFKGLEAGEGRNTAWYKIPVNSVEEVIAILLKHDNFKIKF